MSDELKVQGIDGVWRAYDEHFDCMSDVKDDPHGAWEAIQKQHARIEALQAQLAKAREDALREAALKASFLANTDANMAAVWRAGCSDTHDAILALIDTPTPAPSPDALVKAALEHLENGFSGDPNLDRRICCNGVDCGCQGATAESYVLYVIRAAANDPATVAAIIERAGK